jgi:HSP20 family protein
MPEKFACVPPVEPEAASLDLVELRPQFERMNRVLHMSITEADNIVTLQAEVPGFDPSQLEINLEPRRVTILGKKPAKKSERGRKPRARECSCEVLRVFDLPVEIDTAKTTATLKEGVVELQMPKVGRAQPTRVEVKSV